MNPAGNLAQGGAASILQRAAERFDALRPALMFGLRLSASVSLALYVAFWLELENPSWAGTTAAIVCQPQLGASLRKASFRMIGTIIGAVAIVVLTALFPQDRAGFLLGLALWSAACGFVATILRNFAAYAAALAGYTAAIIASDALANLNGPSADIFMTAIFRASEICIGILCAGVVLAGTDLGSARRRLAGAFGAVSAEIAGRLLEAFRQRGPDLASVARRELIRRIVALDPIIDQAIGEASDLRYRSRTLQAATTGMVAAVFGWRTIARHIEVLPAATAAQECAELERRLPQELRLAAEDGTGLLADPARARALCWRAARALATATAPTPSLRLLAAGGTEAWLGMSRALNGLTALADPARAIHSGRGAELRVPDWLPALINAVRAFVTIGAVTLFWIATAWPSGALAIAFAAVVTLLLSPQADKAYPAAMMFLIGAIFSAVLVLVVKFAILPQIVTFAGLSLVIGAFLMPLGVCLALQWRPFLFTAAVVNFPALLAPDNAMTFDIQQYYDSALAILSGVGVAALGIRLLPPLAPDVLARRLLRLTLRDLRRLARGDRRWTRSAWESRVYSRLVAMPDQAAHGQRVLLAGAMTVGREIVRLRASAARFRASREFEAVLDAVARGQSRAAVARLEDFDRALARSDSPAALRARGGTLAMSEALAEYGSYFDAEA